MSAKGIVETEHQILITYLKESIQPLKTRITTQILKVNRFKKLRHSWCTMEDLKSNTFICNPLFLHLRCLVHPAIFHFWALIQYKIVLYNIKMTQYVMTTSFALSRSSLNKSIPLAASWHSPVTLKRTTALLHPPLDV